MVGVGKLAQTEMATQGIGFTPESLTRAICAVKCSPFTLKLLAELAETGVSLHAIAHPEGTQNQYLTKAVGLTSAENCLLWLVQVGVLRREVDGQGITDSFRLTPLGFRILEQWRSQGSIPSPTLGDRLRNFLAQIQISRFL
jgi:hypothetical protein